MITATDLWKRAIIKINGQAINRPSGAIELGPEIEETLIHRGYAIAFDPALKEDAIVEEFKAETIFGPEFGQEDAIVEEVEAETISEPEFGQEDAIVEEVETPIKSSKRNAKK